MSKTFNSANPNNISAVSLEPIVSPLYNQDALNLIKYHTVKQLTVQWDRQIGDSKIQGERAYKLGKFLEKIKIKSYEDLFASNYVREVSRVQYFGLTAELNKVGEAAIRLVDFFNDLASKNLIRGVLAPLTAVELVGGKIVLVTYIAIDQPNEALVQSMYGNYQFQEGGIPAEMK